MAKKSQLYCNRCAQVTWHDIIATTTQTFTPETHPDMGIDFACATHETLACAGCEQGSFRTTWVTSEDYVDPETGTLEGSTTVYPPRTQDMREPRPYRNLPKTLSDLYHDVVRAHNENMPLLCAAGLRALVEGLCKDQRVSSGQVKVKTKKGPTLKTLKDLRGRIEGLAQKGLLTPRDAKVMHSLRFMGNEAVHELQAPPIGQIRTAIDVIEHMFDGVYELDEKAADLPSGKTRRKRAAGKRIRTVGTAPATRTVVTPPGSAGTSAPSSSVASAPAAPVSTGNVSGTS